MPKIAGSVFGALGAALLCLPLAACDRTDEGPEKHESTSYTYSGRTLTIRAGDSGVRLRSAGSGSTVRVERTLKGKAGKAGNSTWSLSGSTLRLSTHCDGISVSCSARYTVTLPKNIAVHLVSTNGKVGSVGLTQAQQIESRNAPVTVQNASGRVRLTVHDGNAEATGVTSGTFSAETGNGRLKVVFAKPPRKADASATNGNVNVTLPRGDEKYRVHIAAQNGQAHSSVPDSSGAGRTVEVHSRNGSARVDRAR